MNKENVQKKIKNVIERFAEELSQLNESQPVITEVLKERPARPDAVESKLMAEYKARQLAEANQSQSSLLSSEKSTKR